MRIRAFVAAVFVCAGCLAAQPAYDLLLKGGHVIDPKNKINGLMDVAIARGRIAQVGPGISAAQAKNVVDVSGLYVTPGLIDIHVHVYTNTGQHGLTGDSSVYPDAFSFRSCVTTMVDAGSAGWRNFPDFKEKIIDRSRTRVLAFLNISGGGMGPTGEQDKTDLDPLSAALMARQNSKVIVGYKTAHYGGPEWISVENAIKAGELTNQPMMVDFGANRPERTIEELLTKKLRPGDIYTHVYSGLRNELLPAGRINPALIEGQKRGVVMDIGHGGGSFRWSVAVQAYKENLLPDVVSTDLHTGSMNAGMKDMLNVASKILNLGSSLEETIRLSTWKPANVIKRPDLGHLSVGAEADVAVIRLESGQFGFIDSYGSRLDGTKRLSPEMTIRHGQVVWDLNGRSVPDWKTASSSRN